MVSRIFTGSSNSHLTRLSLIESPVKCGIDEGTLREILSGTEWPRRFLQSHTGKSYL